MGQTHKFEMYIEAAPGLTAKNGGLAFVSKFLKRPIFLLLPS